MDMTRLVAWAAMMMVVTFEKMLVAVILLVAARRLETAADPKTRAVRWMAAS